MAAEKTMLEQYRNGERPPTSGRVTVEEVLALLAINERLMKALRDQTEFNVDHISRHQLGRVGLRVHFAACAALTEAQALMTAAAIRSKCSGSQT